MSQVSKIRLFLSPRFSVLSSNPVAACSLLLPVVHPLLPPHFPKPPPAPAMVPPPPHDAHCRSAVVLAGSLVPIVRCGALLAPEAISGRGGDEGPGGAGPGGWAHAWRVCYVSRRWAFWSRRGRRRGGRRGGGEDKKDGGGQEEEKAKALADGVAGCRARG